MSLKKSHATSSRYKILSAHHWLQRKTNLLTRRRKVIFRCLEINICLNVGSGDSIYTSLYECTSKKTRWFNTFFHPPAWAFSYAVLFLSFFAHLTTSKIWLYVFLRRRKFISTLQQKKIVELCPKRRLS